LDLDDAADPDLGRGRGVQSLQEHKRPVSCVAREEVASGCVYNFGQVIDVYSSTRRYAEVAWRFFQRARTTVGVAPVEVITDRAPTYPRVLEELWPAAWHHIERYANNLVEADHAQLKRRLRPMCGIKTMTGLRILAAGHAFVQNLRRGHYEIATDQPHNLRLATAFRQLATAI